MSSANDTKTEMEKGLVSENPKTFWKEYKKNVKKSYIDKLMDERVNIKKTMAGNHNVEQTQKMEDDLEKVEDEIASKCSFQPKTLVTI